MTAEADADTRTGTTLISALTARARAAAHPHTPAAPCACAGTPLADRPDATVVRHAGTVAKAHAPDTDPTALALRVTTAARLPDVLLPPLTPAPAPLHDRLVTFWPYGVPVDPDDPDAAPWESAATLLALLHRAPVPAGLPPMRGPAKAARAIGRLHAALRATPDAVARAAARPVLAAWAGLPAWARAAAPMPGPAALCHGDLHLGQLVRHPAPDGPWKLIDVDDLGAGVPAWDLARPAAWYACGLLPPDEWTRFLAAYRQAGGPAVPPDGDPWPALDVPARALTVQTAALAVTKALAAGRPPDEVEQAVVDACARMPAIPPRRTPGIPD
ncbi:phosphotransferase family protein [Streptomyces sp. SP2-10]|uniref:phosphotransferase family protein n=1 Tax=Streptomyces sp. SP2-10 TaxID=2873385 RepID=UPI001CA6AFF3|nr:aminoglycoside phosphotransferase family protein [Streptomyces sp. SP2-10]MBY8842833.1 aminoglycoside phosphotransferase family protein [Streptomyces sp. SP2-10]